MRFFPQLTTAILTGLIVLMSGAANSEPLSSGWVDGPHARARIIAKPWDGKSAAVLGVQLDLEKGWKTYWRNPGDAGVPPQLNWKGSLNTKSPRLNWPAPVRMADAYGVSIGYKHGVILPVYIEAARSGKAMKLSLEINYGVCAEVCIPVTANLTLDLEPGAITAGPHDALIETARAKVPQKEATDWFIVTALHPWSKKEILGYEVVISSQGRFKKPELFVEGPRAYYFTVPEIVSHKNGQAKFRFEVDGVKSLAELGGEKLTFTLSDANRAAEKIWVIK